MSDNQLELRTELTAKFISPVPCATPEEQMSLDALNHHAEEIAERLQTAFRLLITEMLDVKRVALKEGR